MLPFSVFWHHTLCEQPRSSRMVK